MNEKVHQSNQGVNACCEKNEILPSKVKMRFSRVFFNTEPKSLIGAKDDAGCLQCSSLG